ncbi:MAG: hypothetical protein ACE37F_01785 [Nannocystaceae bacterium]|nr:hypothetical protein [bacterium]
MLFGCADTTPSPQDTDDGDDTSGTTDASTTGSTSSPVETSSADETSADEGSTGGDATQDPYVVGSRLEPILHRNADGDEILAAWHDPELGVDCSFAQTAGGSACVPSTSWSEGFADADCITPAGYWSGCGDIPEYARTSFATCGPVGVHRRGAPLAQVYRRDANGFCVEQMDVEGFEIEPVDDTALVTASRSVQAADEQLGYWRYVADDGSAESSGPIRLEDEQTCEPVRFGDDAACLANESVAVTAGFLHQDAACSGDDVAYGTVSDGCRPPEFARDFEGNRRTVTEALDVANVWFGSGPEGCTPLSEVGVSYEVYAHQPFQLGDAPSLDLQAIGEGRLQLQQPVSADGSNIGRPHYLWLDTELGFECGRIDDTNGEQRCAPYRFATTSHYEDPACEQPLLSEAEATAGTWRTVVDYSGSCERHLRGVAEVGDLYEGTAYRRTSEGGCEEAPAPSFELRTLDVRPPSELAVLEEVRP